MLGKTVFLDQNVQDFIGVIHRLSVHPCPGIVVGNYVENSVFRIVDGIGLIVAIHILVVETEEGKRDSADRLLYNVIVDVSKGAKCLVADLQYI